MEADIEIVESDVIKLLTERVIPLFEKVASEADTYQLMRCHRDSETQYPLYQIQLACLAVHLGDPESGVRILGKVKENPVWGENAEKAMIRLQIYSRPKF